MSIIKIKNGFLLREIGSRYMVIPVGERTNDLHGMIELNETAAFLWKNLKKECSKEELLSILLDEYDISKNEAEYETENFICKLNEMNFLE